MTLSPFSMLDIFYTFLAYFHPSFCIHYCYNRSWRFILKMPSSATSHMFCFMPSSSPSTVWMPVGSCSTIWHMYSWFTTGLKNLYLCLGCLAFDSRLDKTDLDMQFYIETLLVTPKSVPYWWFATGSIS